ncbi:hypothetical protein [Alteromonas sp. A079]|uniref:hypothetical protein n=1 Tax=Alteromonas sp. A079 TaxID=3410268 RepID=UPI003B9F4AAB
MKQLEYAQRRFSFAKRQLLHAIWRKIPSYLHRWRSLNFAQRCYFSATFLLMIDVLFIDSSNALFQVVMFSMVLVGLLNEFWPRFMLAWDSLIGRSLILFAYAVMANFALASASGLVNTVTGVSVVSLPYSHNFAIILMLPSWFFVTTLFILVSSQLLMPLYLLVLVLLKPFGIHGLWHAPDYKYVFTTALLRYVWTFALLIKLLTLSMQSGVIEFFNESQVGTLLESVIEVQNEDKVQVVGEVDVDSKPSEPVISSLSTDSAIVDAGKNDTQNVEDELEQEIREAILQASANSEKFLLRQRKLLAHFIYIYEADSYSRCSIPDNSRVVEINDYEILTIAKTEDNDLGYVYEVIACKSAAIGSTIAP